MELTVVSIIKNLKSEKINNKDSLWAESLKKLQLLVQKIAFSKRKYSYKHKTPEYKPPPPPQEIFFEKAFWP